VANPLLEGLRHVKPSAPAQPSSTPPHIRSGNRDAGGKLTDGQSHALYIHIAQGALQAPDRNAFLQAHLPLIARLNDRDVLRLKAAVGGGLASTVVPTRLKDPASSYIGSQLKKAAQDIANTPGGFVHLATQNPIKSLGELGHGALETVKHPGRDLLQTATLAGAVASGGGSLAGRATAVGKVATDAAETSLPRAVGALSKAEARAYRALADPKHLAQVDEPTMRLIAEPTARLRNLLNIDQHLASVRTQALKAAGEGKLKPRPLRPAEKPAAKVRAAANTKTAQVAKAAVKTPLPAERTISIPGENGETLTVHPLPSKNYAANLVQRKVLDRLHQRQINRRAAGREPNTVVPLPQTAVDVGAKAVGGNVAAGRELRAARVVQDALEIAPAARLARYSPSTPAKALTMASRGRVNVAGLLPKKLHGERLSAAEQKAVDIAASGVPAAEHVRYHENLIARDVGSAPDHRLQIALARAAQPHLDAIKAGDTRLATAVAETRALSRKGETIKSMGANEAAHRVGARAADLEAIAAGRESPLEELQRLERDLAKAKAKPVEGDLAAATGKVSDALAANVAEQARYKPKLRSAESAAAQAAATVAVPRFKTVDAARAHADKLGALYEELVNKTMQKMKGDAPFDKAETGRRTAANRARFKKGGGARGYAHEGGGIVRRVSTQSVELRRLAEDRVNALLAKHASEPWAEAITGQLDQAEALRSAVGALEDRYQFGGGKPTDAELRTLGEATRRPKPQQGLKPDATLAKLRRQESDLRTRLEQLGTHARIQQIHQDLTQRGRVAVEEGAFYLPSKERGTFIKAGPRSKRPTQTGVATEPVNPSLKHPFGGALQRSGRQRYDATRLAAESYTRDQRFAAVDRGVRQLFSIGKSTQEAAGGEAFAIPIRLAKPIPDWLKKKMAAADFGELTRRDVSGLSGKDVEEFVREIFPDKAKLRTLTPKEMESVRWVDRRHLGGLTPEVCAAPTRARSAKRSTR
jgi:hypothetical protein